MLEQFWVAAVLLWAIGWLVKNGKHPDESGESLADVALLPFSMVRIYHAGQYKRTRARVMTVVIALAMWAFAVWIVGGMVHQYLPYAGSCPPGQHLAGGQGGGEQYCELDG